MTTRTFSTDELDAVDPVLDIHVDSGRWSEYHEIVFLADDGKLYQFEKEVGLTEMQDYYGPQAYPAATIDGDVECHEVEIYEEPVITRKWRPLP